MQFRLCLLVVLAIEACSTPTQPSSPALDAGADAQLDAAHALDSAADSATDGPLLSDATLDAALDAPTSTDAGDLGVDAFTCESTERLCAGVCATCPTTGVAATECNAANCVASACTVGYVLSGAACVVMPTLAQEAYAKSSNSENSDNFGAAVAISADGNTLAVGAPLEDSSESGAGGSGTDNTAPESGAVYVFIRSGTTWSQQAYLKASNTDANDHFGSRLALSADGTTLAVGADQEDSNAVGINGDEANDTAVDAGAVYVFARSGSAWSQQAYVKASNTDAYDHFGRAVSLSSDGNTLAVGASDEDSSAVGVAGSQADNSAIESGAAYLFTRSSATWVQDAYIKASNTETADLFGSRLALSADGGTLAVSAVFEDSNAVGIDGSQTDNSADGSGAVYVFTHASGTWSQQAYVKASNTGAHDWFGVALALSANGDTLAVGADEENSAVADGSGFAMQSGAVYVFSRVSMLWSQQVLLKAPNVDVGDKFGDAVALSGDGNTLLVGALWEDSHATGIDGDQSDNSADSSGASYLFTRSVATWSLASYLKASNTGANDQFGTSLALSLDASTFVVGAPIEDSNARGIGGSETDNSASSSGAAYVFAVGTAISTSPP